MKDFFRLLAVLTIGILLGGCREDANSFFSGRPSGMSMAHNRVLDGTTESMTDLLRVPRRFPDANESQKASWQESIIAWWRAKDGPGRIRESLSRLAEEELRSAEAWVAVRGADRSKEKAATLDEVAAAMKAVRKDEGPKR